MAEILDINITGLADGDDDSLVVLEIGSDNDVSSDDGEELIIEKLKSLGFSESDIEDIDLSNLSDGEIIIELENSDLAEELEDDLSSDGLDIDDELSTDGSDNDDGSSSNGSDYDDESDDSDSDESDDSDNDESSSDELENRTIYIYLDDNSFSKSDVEKALRNFLK